jgi:hypothetical protein
MPVLVLAHDKRSMTVNLSEEFRAISTVSFLRKNSQPPSKQFALNSKIIIAKKQTMDYTVTGKREQHI